MACSVFLKGGLIWHENQIIFITDNSLSDDLAKSFSDATFRTFCNFREKKFLRIHAHYCRTFRGS